MVFRAATIRRNDSSENFLKFDVRKAFKTEDFSSGPNLILLGPAFHWFLPSEKTRIRSKTVNSRQRLKLEFKAW